MWGPSCCLPEPTTLLLQSGWPPESARFPQPRTCPFPDSDTQPGTLLVDPADCDPTHTCSDRALGELSSEPS